MINEIIQADVMVGLHMLPSDSIDMVVTSPPYWGLRSYGEDTYSTWFGDQYCEHIWETEIVSLTNPNRQGLSGGTIALGEKTRAKHGLKEQTTHRCRVCDAWHGPLGLERDPDEYVYHLRIVAAEIWRVLKPTGTFWFNIGDTYKDKRLMGIPERVYLQFIKEWICRNRIIWAKSNPTPDSVRDRFTKAHEIIYLFVKNKKYYFDLDSIKVPRKSGEGVKNPGDWWEIQVRPDRSSHIAVFPEDLIEPMVKAGCPPDGVVLDPFCGRGTALKVAKNLGRNYIGIEIKPEYVELARNYINDNT